MTRTETGVMEATRERISVISLQLTVPIQFSTRESCSFKSMNPGVELSVIAGTRYSVHCLLSLYYETRLLYSSGDSITHRRNVVILVSNFFIVISMIPSILPVPIHILSVSRANITHRACVSQNCLPFLVSAHHFPS